MCVNDPLRPSHQRTRRRNTDLLVSEPAQRHRGTWRHSLLIDVDLNDAPVAVLGSASDARRALRRYRAGGAVVEHWALPGPGLAESLQRASLVVIATRDPLWDDVIATTRCATPVIRHAPASSIGHITLVGGGPGAPELMTVAARAALGDADVVFCDRLGPRSAVREMAVGAEIVDVGKRPGHHAVPQEQIERLMVERALRGEHVVRLKGGDPFVLGRGREEVEAALAEGIHVSVIPGVTSAIAAPSAAGIPVTYRGVSQLFTVLSGHTAPTEEQCRQLKALGGTVVILMGVGTVHRTAAALVAAGMAGTTPVGIIERAHTPEQRTTVCTLEDLSANVARVGCASPAVIVIGDVVRLAHCWPPEFATSAATFATDTAERRS